MAATPVVPDLVGTQPDDAEPTLKLGAISFVSNVVVGLASVAPAYSLAATFGFIVALKGMGVHAPAVMLVSFIPILGVAYAFKAFNQIEPDCGTSFAWVTRAVGPKNGWLQGWAVFVADIIVMASLAVIASSYTFLFLGLDSLSSSATALVLGSIVWIATMTWVAWRGIELSARTQQVLFVVEVIVIVVFSIGCFIKAGGHPGHMSPTLEWFNPFGVSFGVLAQGVLLGLFIYWGWDTGVSINEETENSRDTPGTAAVLSTVLLLGIYLIVGTATQTFGGTTGIANNPDDIFSYLGPQVLGTWFSHVLFLIIVMSAAASTQTTIMPGARQALSMARRKSIPAKFARIHPKLQTPDYATIFVGIVSAAWTVFLLAISPGQNVLGDSVTAVGFAICFYYGGTALAGAWYFRRVSLESPRKFVELMILPLMGGSLMAVIFVYAIVQDGNPDNASTAVLGIGTPVIIGIGALLLGVPLMFAAMAKYKPFFRGETMPSLESYEQNQADPSILAAIEPDLPHSGA